MVNVAMAHNNSIKMRKTSFRQLRGNDTPAAIEKRRGIATAIHKDTPTRIFQ